MKKDVKSCFSHTGNIHLTSHINMGHKDKQGGGEVQQEITRPIAPDTLIMIREVLAEGIARSLVQSAIETLHKNDEKIGTT